MYVLVLCSVIPARSEIVEKGSNIFLHYISQNGGLLEVNVNFICNSLIESGNYTTKLTDRTIDVNISTKEACPKEVTISIVRMPLILCKNYHMHISRSSKMWEKLQ